MSKIPAFNGFTEQTFKFFSDLEKNNNTNWFNINREIYQNNIVLPSRAFVNQIAPFFLQLNPSIRTEAKFNKTLMRINKDMRFAKGDPYRNYFLIHFGRFKMDSEFYLYFNKEEVHYGLFLNSSGGDELYFKNNLEKYKNELINTFKKFEINNKFDLFGLDKEPVLIKKRFNIQKDFDKLANEELILLQKVIPVKNKKLYSASLINEAIKTYSRLYPAYCFAISPEPLKLLDQFEERMGVAKET